MLPLIMQIMILLGGLAVVAILLQMLKNTMTKRSQNRIHEFKMHAHRVASDLENRGKVYVNKYGTEVIVINERNFLVSQYGSHKTNMTDGDLKRAGFTSLGDL